MCASFQLNFKKSHLTTVKRILRYLIKTQSIGLWYLKLSSIDIIYYLDINFASCKINHKNISRTFQFLGVKHMV